MNKNLIISGIAVALFNLYACSPNEKKEEPQPTQITTEPKPSTSASEPKDYVVTAMPDSILLGKNKEAFVRIKDIKAIELFDPEGKNTGMELTYKIELTNKNAIGGDAIGLESSYFRLELDNGNKIAPQSIYVSTPPESTRISDEDKFVIPAGTKPVALSLFFDETRVTVKIDLK